MINGYIQYLSIDQDNVANGSYEKQGFRKS
jgi:hypothetical protein